MAQKRNRQGSPVQARKKPPIERPKRLADLAAETVREEAAAARVVGGALPEPAAAAQQEVTDPQELRELWARVLKIKAAYEEGLARVADRETDLTRTETERTGREETLRRATADAKSTLSRAYAAEAAQEERGAALDAREQRLVDREIDYARRAEREKESHLAAALDALEPARRRLEEERQELAGESAGLRRLRAELQAREEDLSEARQLLRERVDVAVQGAVEELRLRYDALSERHRVLQEYAGTLDTRLVERERTDRAFGRMSPEEVLGELERLRGENHDLRSRGTVPPDLMARMRELSAEQERWQSDRALLLAQNERLQRQLSSYQITALELERMKVGKEALEVTVTAYRERVDELRRDVEGLTERKNGQSPFPECARMDAELAEEREDLTDELSPLPEFVRWLRGRIAHQNQLFYSECDLRVFLGGLASTRLHLLQGISGIGKTQLPQVFAHAIRAKSAIISVGADWRTPQDLLGYYNAFERRFYESPFTQALYRAQCPQHADRPFFLVLDEMNLSHPEQYFNDVLMELELSRPDGEPRHLELMTTVVHPAPRLLLDGRKLPIPPNVWFLGTANHDETTVRFADKTYDRAHVLELPPHPERFRAQPVEPLERPPSLRAFTRAFDQARLVHRDETAQVARHFEGELRDLLHERFRIAVGSRTYRQLDSFTAVVCAAGGTPAEAADHVLATKVLRKIEGRYEIKRQVLKDVRDVLPRLWKGLKGGEQEPLRSIAFLDEQLHLRGGE